MIFLFTDFGTEGPYLGQVQAVLRRAAPESPVIALASDAPRDPILAGYLLAALARMQPEDSFFFCVVDPGVGGERQAVALKADGRWFTGPDNGLLNTVARQAQCCRWFIIDWRPQTLSASFHGRDLFAPVVARLARGESPEAFLRPWRGPSLDDWATDLAQIVYIDRYGNAFSGWRYTPVWEGAYVYVNGHRLAQARTFCEVPEGQAFWYRNSLDLVEIAVNQGRADSTLGLSTGTPLHVEWPPC